jgi:hypothetical protein
MADESLKPDFFNARPMTSGTGQPMSQDPLLLSAVMHLMNNDWFRRVWVVQEAALATNLRFLCGEHEINRIVLKDAASNVQSIVTLYKTCGIPLDLGLDQAQTLFSTCSMVKDYWRERRSVCTHPEDRIRGIIGMFDPADLENTYMDPHLPSLNFQDLYTRFSTMVFTGLGPNAKLWWLWLGLAFTLQRCEWLSSWVPDLHHQSKGFVSHPERDLVLQTWLLHEDDVKKQNMARCDFESRQLVLRGKILEDIIFVYPEIPEAPENYWSRAFEPVDVTFLVNLAEWEEKIAHAVPAVDPMETDRTRDADSEQKIPLDTYWRTLIGNAKTVAVDWYRDFHTACEQIKGLVVNYDVVVKYAAVPSVFIPEDVD